MPSVAIIGASADRSKYGNRSVHAHRSAGYDVYPVNPRGGEIEGLATYASIADIPAPIDRVSMYVPPHVGLNLLDDIAAAGCQELWLNPGSDSAAVIARANELGLNIVQACSIIDASG